MFVESVESLTLGAGQSPRQRPRSHPRTGPRSIQQCVVPCEGNQLHHEGLKGWWSSRGSFTIYCGMWMDNRGLLSIYEGSTWWRVYWHQFCKSKHCTIMLFWRFKSLSRVAWVAKTRGEDAPSLAGKLLSLNISGNGTSSDSLLFPPNLHFKSISIWSQVIPYNNGTRQATNKTAISIHFRIIREQGFWQSAIYILTIDVEQPRSFS